jgi:hypothetical protein
MEANFDLDVNNYTMDDLIKFFKLENTFSLEDLFKKEEELAIEILSVDNKKYDSKYKFDIINFIKSAKEILKSFHGELQNVKEIKKNVERFLNKDKDPRVGKIINPLSSHQALEDTIIPHEGINGYGFDVITSVYVFNTGARNDFFTTPPSECTFDLPIKWRDVISISLASASIPNVMYAFNEEGGSNQIYIEENGTGKAALVTLPEGNYSAYKASAILANLVEASFPDTLEKVINEQVLGIFDPTLYRFKVNISLSTRKTTISNTTYTFRMNLLKRFPSSRCSTYSSNIFVDYGDDYVPSKRSVPVYSYLQTMGFLMGFRELEYDGSNNYVSESIFSNTYSNYLYFMLDDYTGSQTASTTFGVLGSAGILDNNILAVIPLSSGLFATTFDNNSNFIFKKRDYFGPVDISRISVKLTNQRGNIVNLHQTDFNFSLQVKTIYNLTQKSKLNLRGSGPF